MKRRIDHNEEILNRLLRKTAWDKQDEEEARKAWQKLNRNILRRGNRGQVKLAEKIAPKWIKTGTKKYLVENALLGAVGVEHLGGKGVSSFILWQYFTRNRDELSTIGRLGGYFNWQITKSYLKRFFVVRESQRELENLFEFELLDDPKPKNYPSPEQITKAWKRWGRTGKGGRILDIVKKEEREKVSEIIRDTLSGLGESTDSNFRYDIFVNTEMVDLFRERGLQTENLRFLKFFFRINTTQFHKREREWYHKRTGKELEFNFIREHMFPEYSKLKEALLQKGISKDVFDTAECEFFRWNLAGFLLAVDNFARPLFLMAYFLKKEHPDIYRLHLQIIRLHLDSIQTAHSEAEKHFAGSMIRLLIDSSPLFRAVYEDYLFDGDKYMKVKQKKEGRPEDIATNILVYVFVEGLKAQKQLIQGSIYETTAKLINTLFVGGYHFEEYDQNYHYPLSKEGVRNIYQRIRKWAKLRKEFKK